MHAEHEGGGTGRDASEDAIAGDRQQERPGVAAAAHPSASAGVRDIVVVGASAGGVEALQTLVAGFPATLPASVFVVLHIPAHAPSRLPEILGRASRLPVVPARDGAPIVPGQIHVAVPDRHLLVERDRIRVARGPKENCARPAVDVLFRSAACLFGPRVVGVVLTGNLDDGTAGLWAVKDRGGVGLVQAPDEAPFPSMPQSALRHVAIDRVLPIAQMAEAITALTRECVALPPSQRADAMDAEVGIALGEDVLERGSVRIGSIVPDNCPECHGTLSEIREGSIVRYRCHTGHAFSRQTLHTQSDEAVDRALWNTLRVR